MVKKEKAEKQEMKDREVGKARIKRDGIDALCYLLIPGYG